MARQTSDKIPLPLIRNMDSINTLVEEGKVFGIANTAVGTAVTGPTGAYVATTPTFTFRNTGSKVMIPLFAKMHQTGVVADIRIKIHVSTLDTGQFTSGTAITAFNRNQWSSNASTVMAFSSATLPAFTTGNQKLVHTMDMFQTVTAANADTDGFPEPGFTMIRPGGQLDIYTVGSTSAPSWFFNIEWAELEV
mgnify:FL=1